jgi:hypothetical protein
LRAITERTIDYLNCLSHHILQSSAHAASQYNAGYENVQTCHTTTMSDDDQNKPVVGVVTRRARAMTFMQGIADAVSSVASTDVDAVQQLTSQPLHHKHSRPPPLPPKTLDAVEVRRRVRAARYACFKSGSADIHAVNGASFLDLSAKSASLTSIDFTGFYNCGKMLAFAAYARVIVENFLKYGLLLAVPNTDALRWENCRWPVYVALSLPLSILIVFATQVYALRAFQHAYDAAAATAAAKKKKKSVKGGGGRRGKGVNASSNATTTGSSVLSVSSSVASKLINVHRIALAVATAVIGGATFAVPVYVVHRFEETALLPGMVTLMVSIVLSMKLVSYTQVMAADRARIGAALSSPSSSSSSSLGGLGVSEFVAAGVAAAAALGRVERPDSVAAAVVAAAAAASKKDDDINIVGGGGDDANDTDGGAASAATTTTTATVITAAAAAEQGVWSPVAIVALKRRPLTFLKSFLFFLMAPTLCYQHEYPRTPRIRRTFVVKRAAELLFCMVSLIVNSHSYTCTRAHTYTRALVSAHAAHPTHLCCDPGGGIALLERYKLHVYAGGGIALLERYEVHVYAHTDTLTCLPVLFFYLVLGPDGHYYAAVCGAYVIERFEVHAARTGLALRRDGGARAEALHAQPLLVASHILQLFSRLPQPLGGRSRMF